MISEKEFALVNEIASNKGHTQRTLSQKLGVSLGLTNLLLKKLAKQGHIKVSQLDKRKAQYILTPKGFAEKAKKSYNYVLKSITALRKMNEALSGIIRDEIAKGNKRFLISGNGELKIMTEIILKEFAADGITCIQNQAVQSVDVILETRKPSGNKNDNNNDTHNTKVIYLPEAIAEKLL